ncbi:hypothetical protein NEAUS03_0383 [Nematocida ausubeli]|nr:hypothetical protein NEAUS03_0383 [Nematocida ausubeli]
MPDAMDPNKDKNNLEKRQKRMQAIYELFESESEYVYDLVLWTRTIKHLVVNTTTLDVYSKQVFLSKVIGNSDSIYQLHDAILINFMKTLKIARNTPKDVFLRLDITPELLIEVLKGYSIRKTLISSVYIEYAGRVPQATGTMEILIEDNKNFDAEISDVLHRINRLHLGCSHFIMRPMQKITRYPLLFKAILKQALPEEAAAISEEITNIQQINLHVNQNVQYSTEYFTLFHLSHEINYRHRPAFSIGIIQKNRKLIRMEEEISLISGLSRKTVSIVILDNAVFLIECIIKIRGVYKKTVKTLLDEYMAPDRVEAHIMESPDKKDIQLEISCGDKKYLAECKGWVAEEIVQVIKDIKEAEQSKFYKFTVEEMENLAEGEDISLSLISPSLIEEWSSSGIGDIVIGCQEYLEVILNNQRTRIVDKKPCMDVVYNEKVSNVFVRIEKAVYSFVLSQDIQQSPPKLRKLIGSTDISFIKNSETENEILLIAKQIGYLGSEELFIFKITADQTGYLTKKTHRRMYIAGDIMDVSFFGKNMVLSSNDFELIDLVDLTTQELLDPLDKTIAIYVDKTESKPLSIAKIDDNLYLVALSDVGFYINKYGSRKKTNIVFLWLMAVNYVFVFKEYIIAIGAEQVKIFTLKDGILRGIFEIANCKHLHHPDYIIIYNDTKIYRITSPEIAS